MRVFGGVWSRLAAGWKVLEMLTGGEGSAAPERCYMYKGIMSRCSRRVHVIDSNAAYGVRAYMHLEVM